MIESCITFLPVSRFKKNRPILYRGDKAYTLEGYGQLCHPRLRQGLLGILPV